MKTMKIDVRQNVYEQRILQLPVNRIGALVQEEAEYQQLTKSKNASEMNKRQRDQITKQLRLKRRVSI